MPAPLAGVPIGVEKPEGMTVCHVSVAEYLGSWSGWAAMGRAGFVPLDPQVFKMRGMDAVLLTAFWQQLCVVLDVATQRK